ncbi:MAG: nucleotide exchange factor GrpE [Chlorobium sp.]|nr:MAG: nucleotide exchange factor GrpE [Chlorobium sp.]
MTKKAEEHQEEVFDMGDLLDMTALEGELSQGNPSPAVDPAQARIAELQAELEEQKELVTKFRDEVLRRAADFENFRRQKEREAMMASSRSLENIIRELLPVVDDIKRLLQHVPGNLELSSEARPYIEGVELVKKNLEKWFAEKGVSAIESLGAKLDVDFHEAISQVDHPEVEPETIIEEYQTGYLLGEKVIRHAKVIVAR